MLTYNHFSCEPIQGNGVVGQMVILDQYSPNKNEVREYTQPAIFTIAEKVEADRCYVLRDTSGRLVKTASFGSTMCYALYDAQSWLNYTNKVKNSKEISTSEKIKELESNLKLLKTILVHQGTRLITKEQAEQLGFPAE